MAGYRHCATEGSAERQRQFEQTLLELMLLKTFPQITVQEVCDRVGLSRKSFYRYFSGLESCLQALVDHTILGFSDMSSSGEDMEQALERFFSYWKAHLALLDALSRSSLHDVLYRRAIAFAEEEYGIQDYFFRGNENYDQAVFFINGLFGVLLNWYGGGCRKSPAQLAAALSRHSR